MQLVLVSGLSGSGKSIALNVLEDGGYYCVDNLPATLLLETIDFLSEAGHDRVGVSIDARSAALPALPEHLAELRRRGVDCRVLYLESSPQALLRRFSETRRRHPLAGSGFTLPAAIQREHEALAPSGSVWPSWRRKASARAGACRSGTAGCRRKIERRAAALSAAHGALSGRQAAAAHFRAGLSEHGESLPARRRGLRRLPDPR